MNKTIVLKTYNDMAEAGYDKEKLEEIGIKCFLSDENIVLFSSPFGGIKLHIFEKDAEQAIKLLSEPQTEKE